VPSLQSVVVDSSVLVSGFLTRGPAHELLEHARGGTFRIILSGLLLEETRRSLMKPKLVRAYRHGAEAVEKFCSELLQFGEIAADLSPILRTSRDPDDDYVIAAALVAGADCIVTGDDDLLALGQYEGIAILSIRAFLDQLEGTPP
jgi:putative PIN family toxin of toxin-antitoxin system